MRRAALLYCIDIDVPRFKVLRAREQFPIVVGMNDDAESRGANYTLDDAFRMRVTLDMIGDGEGNAPALAPSIASSVVVSLMGQFCVKGRHPLDILAPQDLWGGVVVFEDQSADPIPRYDQSFAGDLSDIPSYIADFLLRWPEHKTVPVRLIMVNVSRAARFVRQRAADLGIPESLESYPDWN